MKLLKLLKALKKSGIIKKKYKIILVKNNDQLKKSYRFRYHLYCEVEKLLKKEDYPNKLEFDKFDEHSIHFVALDNNDNIVGTIRLIKDSELGFPTEEEFNLKEIMKKDNRKKTIEVSRLMTTKEYRKSFLSNDLYKAIYKYSNQNNIEFWLGCVEIWLLKKIKAVFDNIEIIGEPKFCFNAMNYPFLIDLKKMQKELKIKNKFLFYYLNKKSKKIII